MKPFLPLTFLLIILAACTPKAEDPAQLLERLLTLERVAMDQWGRGNPDPYLALMAEDITYFDPSLETELQGLAAMTRYYGELQGQVHIDRYEFVDPTLQLMEGGAVLSYRFYDYMGEEILSRLNYTGVYRREKDGTWKVIHQHYSVVKGVEELEQP